MSPGSAGGRFLEGAAVLVLAAIVLAILGAAVLICNSSLVVNTQREIAHV